MTTRIVNRLNDARHSRFVGREGELSLFASALSASELPFQVLHVYGPGGVGKTTLLREFARLCAENEVRSFRLDGRNIEPAPEPFLNALRTALSITSNESPLDALTANARRQVLLIDTYESLAPLDAWLYEFFFAQLPENVLIVLAGRNPPSPAARSDIGWQTLIRTVSLRNLNPDESRAFLTNCHVPPDQHLVVLQFTHGHPLALSLVADVYAQRHDFQFQSEGAPDVVKILLERFVQKVPGPAHRAALEACALVHMTTEALLSEMLKNPDAHELFEWLRGLSFVESGAQGVYPHDLAREALVADLRWRNPDWYKELHNRARAYYSAHLQSSSLQEQQRLLFDYIFLHRDNPIMRSMFEWQASGILPDTLREGERAALVQIVEQHEGAESARFAEQWLARQPQGVTVYRDEHGQPAGLFVIVEIHRARTDELQADPATRLAWDYLKNHAPLRPGEVAAHYRFWMARDTYQSVSAVQTQVFLTTVRYQLTTPALAYHFLPCADADFWAPALTYGDLTRLPETDYTVGGKKYGVFGHDWRVRPPLAWLALLAEREVGGAPPAATPSAVESLIVLSRTEFDTAVRDALQHYAQADLLVGNPLLRSRLVVDRAGASANNAQRVAALQTMFRETVESLRQLPREAKMYRALDHLYLHPASSQEQAAEAADVPFSTFRRHVKAGVARVADLLWQREIGGGEK